MAVSVHHVCQATLNLEYSKVWTPKTPWAIIHVLDKQERSFEGCKVWPTLEESLEFASKNDCRKSQYDALKMVIDGIREAGAEIIDGTDFPSAEEITAPGGWDWYARLSLLHNILS